MIYHNIEFHNVDHLETVEGMSGLCLKRFPKEFGERLGTPTNYNGRFRAERVHGCELRFVTDSEFFDIALTAVEGDNDIIIYYGDFAHSKHTLRAGSTTVIHILKPEIYSMVDTEQLPKRQFAPNVWRILFGLNGFVYFNYLNTFGGSCRPPKKEEKPEILWAAYGSSITCGSVTNLYSNGYINQAAVHLGYDVLNKGLSGSCLCENFVVDHLAGLKVDVLTLELGVNMINFFDKEEFQKRMEYLLIKIQESTAKRIYVIDMFPNKGIIANDPNSNYYVNYRAFKAILRRLLEEITDNRIIFIHGEEVLKDFTYLSIDLLHPSDNGHIRMGENLAKIMSE